MATRPARILVRLARPGGADPHAPQLPPHIRVDLPADATVGDLRRRVADSVDANADELRLTLPPTTELPVDVDDAPLRDFQLVPGGTVVAAVRPRRPTFLQRLVRAILALFAYLRTLYAWRPQTLLRSHPHSPHPSSQTTRQGRVHTLSTRDDLTKEDPDDNSYWNGNSTTFSGRPPDAPDD